MAHRTWPDLAILQLLVAVDDLGSIGAAATAVGMDQPNASRALRRLERRLGLPLLVRSPRGTQLTADAVQLARWARELLASAEQFTDRVASLGAERAQVLRVAASQTVAEYLLPQWLAAYRADWDGVEVRVSVANSEQVTSLVLEQSVDLGFIEATQVDAQLTARQVGTDHLVVVVAPSHPWSRRRTQLRARELAATALVVREAGSGTREAFETAVAGAGLELSPPLHELGSNAAVRTSAMAGAAPAVLSEHAVHEAVRAGRLVSVPVTGIELSRPLHAVWRAGTQPVPLAADLLTKCKAGAVSA